LLYAVYPEELCIKPIKSSCPPGGIVFDPFAGSGTTLMAARKLGRQFIGCDLNHDYVRIARIRLKEKKM
jgi:DNA modification methylase